MKAQLIESDSSSSVLKNLLDEARGCTVQLSNCKNSALQFAYNKIDALIQVIVAGKVFLDAIETGHYRAPALLSERKSTSFSISTCFNPAPTIPLAEPHLASGIYAIGMLVYFAAMAGYFGVPKPSR